MMTSDDASTSHPTAGGSARQAIWRIFGNGLAPLKQSTCRDLVEPIIQKQLGKPTKLTGPSLRFAAGSTLTEVQTSLQARK